MIVFTDVTLKRGLTSLLEHANASVMPREKVGLVGKNGCGKSTIFSLLRQQLTTEHGDVSLPHNWQIAWVSQETPQLDISALDYVIQGDEQYCQLASELEQAMQANDGNLIATIHAKLDVIDAWTIKSRASTLLHGLGFAESELSQPIISFSGGWRMRLNLAQALLCRSDLLLLDEPTNHLDLDAVIWLERWLIQYTGTLLLISHDRDFLNAIVNKIIHVENYKLNEYSGDYSSFEVQRSTKLAQHNALYKQQQQKVEHLQSFISRFKAKATKAKQAQSRMKSLAKMELIAPAYVDNPFSFSFAEPLSMPNPLLSMQNVSVGYADKIILESIKLNLVPGSRIGLLGRNGAGKSTLVKLLAGELAPLAGNIQLAKGVQLGYFAQHQVETLRPAETALWHLAQLAPQHTEQQLRDYLAKFAFVGDKVYQAVDLFSGGEKARLVLALIVWQKPNLLLLDEPTNHLDLDMRQALTEALVDYQGSLIIIAHDRHLLRTTVDEFYLVDGGRVESFDGDLDDYKIWLQETERTVADNGDPAVDNGKVNNNRKQQKREQAELRQLLAPLNKEIKQLETQIAKLQITATTIETSLADNNIYTAENKATLNTTLQQQRQTQQQLEQLENRWLELQEQLENYTN